ncbi:MAG: hypothetical protein JWM73_196 [Solirubrobacterales bacterium]|nr:hypothetical protein [Solirubrobacterales bacterium]
MLALTSYSVVLALHIIAVLLAYGLPLAYPLMLPYLRRTHPRSMPGVHEVQLRLNKLLTGPGTALVLVLGLYMAGKEHLFDELFVQVGLAAIVIIGAVGGWILGASRTMAELSRADVEASGPDGPVTWSPAYEALYARYEKVELFLGAVVLVTVFFMAAKPG